MIKALDKVVPGDIVYSISRMSNKTIETKLTVTGVIYEGQEVAEIKTSGPTIHLKKISKDGNVLFFKGTSSISDNNEKRFFFTDYSQKNKFRRMIMRIDGAGACFDNRVYELDLGTAWQIAMLSINEMLLMQEIRLYRWAMNQLTF